MYFQMLWNWYTVDACKSFLISSLYTIFLSVIPFPIDIHIQLRYTIPSPDDHNPGFLAESWHITSHGMFGGSCIGVIALVLVLEFLRRVAREYDSYIIRRATIQRQHRATMAASLASKPSPSSSNGNGIANGNGNGIATKSSDPTRTTTISLPYKTDSGLIRPTLFEQLVRAALHMLQFAVAYFVMLLAMYFNGYIIICIFIGAFLGAFIFSWEPLACNDEE